MANNTIGTAWIQIKPSLRGISNDISKELAAASIAGGNSFNQNMQGIFAGLGTNLHSTFSNAFNSITNTTKTLLVGGVGTAVGVMASQLGSAISRVDTLRNSHKVFDAMGYSTNAVNTSMNDLNKYLDGLPTSLDGAVQGVQLLSASFGGIEDGTKYFKAINDAGLAFGSSTEMIDNAIRQISQLSLDGPLDAQTWISLQNSGFGPVFAAMANEAGISVGELKKQFGGHGKKTVKQFLEKLTEMDKKGSGSMKSLAEMARLNTDGIATSFKNAKTAVTRGLADMLTNIPNLSKSILTIGKSFEGILNGKISADEGGKKINEAIKNMFNGIKDTLPKIVEMAVGVLPGLVTTITDSLKDLLGNSEQTQKIISGITKLFVAVAAAAGQIAIALIPLIPQVISSLGQELSKPKNAKPIIAGMGILFGFALAKTVGGNLLKKGMGSISNVFGGIFKVSNKKKKKSSIGAKLTDIMKSAADSIRAMGQPLIAVLDVLKQVLVGAVQAIVEPIKTLFQGLGQAIAGFFSALANPAILVGVAMFVAIAAGIAAAIFIIGNAINAVMPAIQGLINNVVIPIATFIQNTLLVLLPMLTDLIINLTTQAIIPLGTFIATSFLAIVNGVTDAIIRLTQQAVIPLISILAGTFIAIMHTVANVINSVLKNAFDGITNIVNSVGDAFTKMGGAIRNALNGVSGVISSFRDLIVSVGDAVIATVALVTHQSVSYGRGFAKVSRAATGGRVLGVGTETSDSNLFALSKGEYVIKASAARQIGYDNLDAMNAGYSNSNSSGNIWNIYVTEATNARETANTVSREIAFRERGVLS